MKPQYHNIDWKALVEAALEDGDRRSILLLKRAQLAFPEDRLTIITPEFQKRLSAHTFGIKTVGDFNNLPLLPDGVTSACFQIENDPESGPAATTMVYVEPPILCTFPIQTGGFVVANIDDFTLYSPSSFINDPKALPDYVTAFEWVLKTFEFVRDVPEVLHYRETPSTRVVRKGKTVRQPPYRVVTMRPGADVVITKRIAQRRAQSAQRAAPAAHEVNPHWRHYNRDPACDHQWMPWLLEDGKKRARCTQCGATKTAIKPFRRGDAKPDARQKVIVVK